MATALRGVGKLFQKFPRIPDKYRGGRLEKIGIYFRNILDDYKAVFIETGSDIREQPLKSGVIFTLLGSMVYLMKTNPDEKQFRQELVDNTNNLLMLSDAIRNPRADVHMQKLVQHLNAGQLRRLNLGILSLMWVDHFEKGVDVYDAHCKSLKVGWLDLGEKVVDIGIANRWLVLQDCMKDFDINPPEWGEEIRHVDVDWSVAGLKAKLWL